VRHHEFESFRDKVVTQKRGRGSIDDGTDDGS
jgi:hypothetical protein